MIGDSGAVVSNVTLIPADHPALVELIEAAQKLLDLKNGPRDEHYAASKQPAWDDLAAALAAARAAGVEEKP